MNLTPSPDWRYVLRRPMRGTDVSALQINLEATRVDGAYEGETVRAVKAVQRAAQLEDIDGIAGPLTQRALVLRLSRPAAQAHDLPAGMLRSIAASESGYFVAAYSPHPSDAGFDLGAYQQSITPELVGSQPAYRHAYSITYMAEETASRLRRSHDDYVDEPHVETDRRAWELAVLEWNWPVAAHNLANLGRIYQDPNRRSDVPESWIETATAGRLHTAEEWVAEQILKKTVYVRWN